MFYFPQQNYFIKEHKIQVKIRQQRRASTTPLQILQKSQYLPFFLAVEISQ